MKTIPRSAIISSTTANDQSEVRKPRIFRRKPSPAKQANALPSRAVKPINEDVTYKCILCKKNFASAEGFKAHHLHVFTRLARCMDRDELTALDFVQRKNGVWATDITTQLLPSQVNRLATVRQELAVLSNLKSP
jgi:hypothetical protein